MSFSEPKYLNPEKGEGLGKSQVIFNIDRARNFDNGVIVEGAFDTISTGDNAMGILGKSLSHSQLMKIVQSQFKSISIALDSGERKAALKMAMILKRWVPDVRICDLPEGDPDILGKEKMNENIRSTWFTTYGGICIGIVLDIEKSKAYIGIAKGHDQAKDEKTICSLGAKFPVHIAEELILK